MGKKMGRPLNSGKDGLKSGKLVTYRITPAAIEYIRQQGNRVFLESLVPKEFREVVEGIEEDIDLNQEHKIERPEILKENVEETNQEETGEKEQNDESN